MSWDWSYALACLPALADGLAVACLATLGGFTLALVVGLSAAVAMHGPWPLARAIGTTTSAIRSTPLLVQLYLLFYALPQLGLGLPALGTGIIALGLHSGSYIAEILRAGIDQVPRGQWDAARALHLPRVVQWWVVILPQAVRPVLPALTNQLAGMLKDTPLLSTITVVELLGAARMIGADRFRYLEPLTLVGGLFLVVSLLAAIPARYLERHAARSLVR